MTHLERQGRKPQHQPAQQPAGFRASSHLWQLLWPDTKKTIAMEAVMRKTVALLTALAIVGCGGDSSDPSTVSFAGTYPGNYSTTGQTARGNQVPATFDFGFEGGGNGLFGAPSLLLVDSVSLVASQTDSAGVLDRARAVATKAVEVRKVEQHAEVRVLVSNGGGEKTDVGRYALSVLRDEGNLDTTDIGGLLALAARRSGNP